MKLRFISALTVSLFLLSLLPVASIAAPLDSCRISASPNQTVSLGFPMAPERLKYKSTPKLLVLPFRLSDTPNFAFGDLLKADYLAAADLIHQMSNGKSKPELVFAPVFDISDTVADMNQLRINQQQQWQRDESKSTWGFIRRVIAASDSKIDFTGIDGVLLHGSSTSNQSDIAEAMMFSKSPRDPWFRTINTAEGELLNAVLMDKRKSINTIAHEIMHLYGLTDLYGSPDSPHRLSMMSSAQNTLLSYEKWVLGWIPDSSVQCVNAATEIDFTKVSTRLTIPNTTAERVLVIDEGQRGKGLIIETLSNAATRYLAFYSLDNEARPPIRNFSTPLNQPSEGVAINNLGGVGAQLISPNFNLLISDMTADTIMLDLIPKAQLPNAAALISAAEANRTRIAQAAATKPNVPTEVIAKPKKKTIVCVKGSTVRKVKAVKPKCPTGFKKR